MGDITVSRMDPYQDVPGPVVDFKTTIPNLDDKLREANVLITGGASGIGKACAKRYLELGGYVTIADLDTLILDETVKELEALSKDRFQAIPCNVTEWPAQIRLFESAAHFGPHGVIDVVIPCAGPRGSWFNFDAPDLAPQINGSKVNIPPPPAVGCIQVALIGMMYTCQLAVWYMARKKESLRCLIVIGSMTAYRGVAGNADYSGAKFGARGLFKTLRDAPANLENATGGPAIRINMLCPGYVRTPLIEASIPAILETGARLASQDSLVDGVLRMSADPSIHGKAIGVGPDGCFDIRDDIPGMNGDIAVKQQVWFARQENVNRPRIGIW